MPTVTKAAISLALLGMLLGWFLLFRPTMLGGPASYVIVSGQSMAPTLHSSDLAVLQKRSDYRPGDIVAFRVPEGEPGEGFLVIHRIVGGSAEDGFVMQGDNKQAQDLWHPSPDEIVGKMWFRVPHVAGFVGILRAPLIMPALAASVAVFLVLRGDEVKKRPRQPLPAEPSHSIRRPRPRGLGQGLLLILTAGARTALRFTARRQGGGRHP